MDTRPLPSSTPSANSTTILTTPTPPIALAERGAAAATEGKIDEARSAITQALYDAPTDLRVLFLGFQFHFRIGELDEAERLVRRRLEIAGPDTDSEPTARAYTNLGLIHFFRKDLDAAEREMTRALEISRRIGNQEGIARDLGNLAMVPEARGGEPGGENELDRAEAMYRESLAIAQRIGADHIAANKLANLGDIALLRGRPAEARTLWTQAVTLFKKTGNAKHHAEFTKKLAELDSAKEPRA